MNAQRSSLRHELSRAFAFIAVAALTCWLARPLAADLREELVLRAQSEQLGEAASQVTAASAVPSSAPPLRVLFVGNSLTAINRMPEMVARLAHAAGEPRALQAHLLTPGARHLHEHVSDGVVKQLLAQNRYDYVVLQNQGQVSGWPQERERFMLEPGRVLADWIAQAGARPVLYATFARRDGDFSKFPGDTYEAMQARVDDGYAALGRAISAPVVPAGHVWQQTLRAHPSLRLWALDGQHPSIAGSYLVACTFLTQLYGRSPVGNRYLAGLPVEDARIIQDSVAREMKKAD